MIGLPSTAGAASSVPISQGEPATIPYEFAPKKQGFFARFTAKIIAKRIQKALGGKYGEEGKWMAIIGFTSGVLGASALALAFSTGIAALILGLVLGVAGLILSLLALDVATSHERRIRWIRNMAIAGIVLNLLLIAFGAGITVLALAFGA